MHISVKVRLSGFLKKKIFVISRDAELIPICNRLLTDLHVVRKMKWHCNPPCHCRHAHDIDVGLYLAPISIP